MRVGGWAACLAILAATPLPGCCGSDFRVADMRGKALETPWDALDTFRTAIRLEDWDQAYDCISTKTVAKITEVAPKWLPNRSAFARFLGSAEMEDLDPHAPTSVARMRVTQLIHRASVRRFKIEPGGARWTVYILYPPLDLEALPIVRERGPHGEDRWTIGIAEWLEERQQS